MVSYAGASEVDIGLKFFYSGAIFKAVADTNLAVSPLHIAKNGTIYALPLVDPASPVALKVRIKTQTLGIKALKKLTFCSPGSTQSCPIANGTGSQTCLADGSAYGTCNVTSCNASYAQSGNSCVYENPSGAYGGMCAASWDFSSSCVSPTDGHICTIASWGYEGRTTMGCDFRNDNSCTDQYDWGGDVGTIIVNSGGIYSSMLLFGTGLSEPWLDPSSPYWYLNRPDLCP